MRLLYLIITAILFCNLVASQELELKLIQDLDTLNLIDSSFYFTNTIPETSSPQYGYSSNERKSLEKNHKVQTLYELEGNIYYEYWVFSKDSLQNIYGDKVFYMPLSIFEMISKPLYRRYKGVSAGAYTIPFRLRGINDYTSFDFESSLSLQANIIFGFGSRKTKASFLDASFGLGLTGVNLNINNSNIIANRTASAFTVSIGTVVKPAKFINFGIFIGWDFLGKDDRETEWVHDGKTWLGLGINISFNEIETNKSANYSKQ